jgi:ATP-dependent Clp protease adaptor protein ClpS
MLAQGILKMTRWIRYSAFMISESASSDSRLPASSNASRVGDGRDDDVWLQRNRRADAPRCAGDDDGSDNRRPGDGDQLGIATKTRAKPKKPSQFKVLMLNDDYTPMEFVVLVLKRFFNMDMEAATRVMLHVHQKGVGVCGIFPYEIAETKVNQVMDFAKEHQHPLQCTLEKA